MNQFFVLLFFWFFFFFWGGVGGEVCGVKILQVHVEEVKKDISIKKVID